MEDNQCVIKELRPNNQFIAKVTMKINRVFPLIIVPEMKEKENIGVAFKVENK